MLWRGLCACGIAHIITEPCAARQPFIEEGSSLQRLFPPIYLAIGVPTAAGVLLLGATLSHIGWTLVASQLARRLLPSPPPSPSLASTLAHLHTHDELLSVGASHVC